ncbi:SPOR domain-containing protein [Luteibacter aegosomatissinici]|uniref:SPOR domain-containing protein n=1 Tax=Luteibacter aegosomatissinici TaxID=2911539 RepID=UPI001FFAEBA0|nr:SPOR domain-containing protein [Luteibacter aegosomatissinici]UPG95298.1 SPOR domain-containing protein [Luteibacter aegosomatissinici]
MLLRLLFVLLIALNIAVAAWLLLGESSTHAVEPSDKGVPELKLLTELPVASSTALPVTSSAALSVAPSAAGSAAPAKAPVGAANEKPAAAVATPPVTPATHPAPTPPAAAPEAEKAVADAPAPPATVPTSAKRSYRCLAVGPFATQVDLRTARTALGSRTVRSRQRQEQTTESHGWRVFLPAQATRDQALAQAKRLEAKGIKDYFVVTAQGELQNSVALGLFHDPANARKRRDEVIAAGFPARMSERTETTPVWWLDVVVPDDASNDVRKAIRAPATARPTGCF